MDDNLYNTSWALYYLSNANTSYYNLIHADERTLARRAAQYSQYLNVNKPTNDSDSEDKRNGGLRACTWANLSGGEPGMLIALVYDKATYKFVLYGDDADQPLSLLLAKGPAGTLKRFINFLASTFNACVDPLRLPTDFLQRVVEKYVDTLKTPYPRECSSLGDPAAPPQSRLHLRTTLGNLKVTLSFSAPVAPQLKTLDLDIPPDTVGQLIEDAESGKGTKSQPKNILALMAHHLHEKTGIKIPTVALQIGKAADDANTVMRISKTTCAAFAISVDGRLKFASKAVDGAMQFEDVVRKANAEMLGSIKVEATRRAKDK